jgi:hypothetical protein
MPDAAVSHRVVQGFLEDPEETERHVGRYTPRSVLVAEINLDVFLPRELTQKPCIAATTPRCSSRGGCSSCDSACTPVMISAVCSRSAFRRPRLSRRRMRASNTSPKGNCAPARYVEDSWRRVAGTTGISVVTRRARSPWPSPPVIPSSVSPVTPHVVDEADPAADPGVQARTRQRTGAGRESGAQVQAARAAGRERGKVHFDARRGVVDSTQRRIGCPLLHVAHGHTTQATLAPLERGDCRRPRGRRLALLNRAAAAPRSCEYAACDRGSCRPGPATALVLDRGPRHRTASRRA